MATTREFERALASTAHQPARVEEVTYTDITLLSSEREDQVRAASMCCVARLSRRQLPLGLLQCWTVRWRRSPGDTAFSGGWGTFAKDHVCIASTALRPWTQRAAEVGAFRCRRWLSTTALCWRPCRCPQAQHLQCACTSTGAQQVAGRAALQLCGPRADCLAGPARMRSSGFLSRSEHVAYLVLEPYRCTGD